MGDKVSSPGHDDSERIRFLPQDGRRFFGAIVAKLRKAQKPLPTKGRRKRRSQHLTHLDLWQLLREQGYYCDPAQVRRIQEGTAPVDPYLAQIVARVLNADEAEAALLSHAAGGDGVAAYMLKLLGLEPYIAVCTARADEAVRGEITIEEFDAILRQMAGTMVLELIRTQQSQTQTEDKGEDAC